MRLKEIAAMALDEAGLETVLKLKEHDKRFHPNGYAEGEACKYRKLLAADDDQDRVVSWALGRDADGKPGGVEVAICDITKETTDAIVNAANRWMLGGGGVDGAIHRAAGPQLLAECKQYPPDENGYRVQTGEAKITGGGNLAAKHVIHTAGPDMRDEEAKDDPENGGKLLRASYRNSLEAAKEAGCKSVSFPSISTGIFGYPLDKAAEYAADEIVGFLAENPEMSVRMCIYAPFDSEKIAAAYERAFKAAEKKIAKREGSPSSPEVEDEAPEVSNLRHLLRTNSISKRDFASSLAALAALGKIGKARVGIIKRQMFAEDAALDEEFVSDLQKHDAKYHGGRYDGKSACKYREDLAKGDKTDNLDPENVEGEEAASGNNQVTAAKAALDKALQGGGSLKDVGDALADYEKAYNDASGGAAVNALQGVLAKVQSKSPNGIVSQIIAKRLAAAQAASAAANLPKGTLTPDEARNYAAMEIAKMLGANLTSQPAATPQQSAPAATAPTPSSPAADTPQSSPNQPTAAAQTVQPVAPRSQQLGPKAALDISAATFPQASDFNFSTYGQPSAGWQGGSGGSTEPHSIVVNGQKYWVKQAGNNPSYSNAAAENEVNANKFLRLAGFNAPESKLYTENGVNYCVTKDTPFSGTAGASNSAAEMREAYPLMSLIYSTDAMQNGNTKRDSNGMVFIDNGSSFGFSAQGNRPNPNLRWDYDSRTEPDSNVNNQSGIMALLSHPSQYEWKNAYGGSPSQGDVLKEAAKYEMGALVREAENQGLLHHLPTNGVASLKQYADGIDKLAAKYKTVKQTQPAAQAASPAPSAQATPSATPASSTGNTAATQTAQPKAQSAASTSTATTVSVPTNSQGLAIPTGPIQFSTTNPLHTQLFNSAHPTWTTPTNNSPSTHLRNAKTIIGALSGFGKMTQNPQTMQIANAVHNILRNGQFTANGRGIGGTVTGANLPRKGIQALQANMNKVLNPQGINMQVHNNGNITFSATNRSIARQALASAGMAATPVAAPAPTASPAATSAPVLAPSPSSPAANSPQPAPRSQGKAWQNHLSALQQGPGASNQQLNAAYQGISNWLNNAGV